MMKLVSVVFVAGLLGGAASPALAKDAPPLGYDVPIATTDRVAALSPEQREAAINGASERDDTLPINGAPDRRIRGEMGIEIGSRGYHALYGTAVVPLGQNGTASFSFLTSGMNNPYRRR